MPDTPAACAPSHAPAWWKVSMASSTPVSTDAVSRSQRALRPASASRARYPARLRRSPASRRGSRQTWASTWMVITPNQRTNAALCAKATDRDCGGIPKRDTGADHGEGCGQDERAQQAQRQDGRALAPVIGCPSVVAGESVDRGAGLE